MDDLILRLSRLDSCAVSDALDKLGLKGSITGIRRFSTDKRIAGRVLTVKLDRAEGRAASLHPPRHLCTAAIEAASPGPSPTALKISNSMAAFRAAVRWCDCTISKTRPGFNGAA